MKRIVRTTVPKTWYLSDFLEHLGDISPNRIRMNPWFGTAVESDVTAIRKSEDRLYELVEGVLIEKVTSDQEKYIAETLIQLLGSYVNKHDLGVVHGTDWPVRLMPGLVRWPDVYFVSRNKLPGGAMPTTLRQNLIPDLVVEFRPEGEQWDKRSRKREEYFFHGVRVVWQIDPKKRRLEVYTSPIPFHRYHEPDTLDGGEVLPGFSLSLKDLFAGCEKAEPKPPPARPKKKRRK